MHQLLIVIDVEKGSVGRKGNELLGSEIMWRIEEGILHRQTCKVKKLNDHSINNEIKNT